MCASNVSIHVYVSLGMDLRSACTRGRSQLTHKSAVDGEFLDNNRLRLINILIGAYGCSRVDVLESNHDSMVLDGAVSSATTALSTRFLDTQQPKGQLELIRKIPRLVK